MKLQRIVVVIGNLYVCNARMTDVWLVDIASPLIGFVGGLRESAVAETCSRSLEPQLGIPLVAALRTELGAAEPDKEQRTTAFAVGVLRTDARRCSRSASMPVVVYECSRIVKNRTACLFQEPP